MKPAGPISITERDYFLGLHEDQWPSSNLPLLSDPPSPSKRGSWRAQPWACELSDSPRYLLREISNSSGRCLQEAVIRFPSCPLFGIQREREYQVNLDPINYHTLRLLRPSPQQASWQAERIFVIFNGLNETDRLDFYYELAGLLIDDQSTACIICPLPGHLMRYPMLGRFAEKPLNRFIGDPSDLFRQYLRAMQEAQWLLSILVPISHYPVVPGTVLLGSSRDPQTGRNDASTLSQEIYDSWRRIGDASARLISSQETVPGQRGGVVKKPDILDTITALRDLIGWQPFALPLSDQPLESGLPTPHIHVIGYSLGGYLAQSVFFTWPFAIGSCTTICSGGALHEIRPVKFAHEEEWKSVTNGLKYELESGMLEKRIALDETDGAAWSGRSLSGIPLATFSSFFRIFNDVFLQDPNGSYRARVSEFAPRLLFMVGGNDPIVTTRSVIAASPREGINMIEVANLSHFVAVEKGEWGDFWLPALSKLLLSFARRTETLLSKAVLENLWSIDEDGPLNTKSYESPESTSTGRFNHREAEPLDSSRFQNELMSLVDLLEDNKSYLFILRNRIPTALLGPRLLERRGTIPQFEDYRIRKYWLGLAERRRKMLQYSSRLTLVLPYRLQDWFVRPGAILSAKSEPSSRSIPDQRALANLWQDFLKDWEPTGSLYCFDPEDKALGTDDRKPGGLEYRIRTESATPDDHPVLNTLPDVWISLSADVVEEMLGSEKRTADVVIAGFHAWVKRIYDEADRELQSSYSRTRIWLESGKLSIIRISSASSNPGYLGERIWSLSSAMDLMVHSSLALSRSRPCTDRAKFTRSKT